MIKHLHIPIDFPKADLALEKTEANSPPPPPEEDPEACVSEAEAWAAFAPRPDLTEILDKMILWSVFITIP